MDKTKAFLVHLMLSKLILNLQYTETVQVMTGQMLGVMTAKEPGASFPMEEEKNKDILINHGPVALLLKCIPSFSMELYKNSLAKATSPSNNLR